MDLLTKLLNASRPARRDTNLMEALGVLELENPHSDYLAWLLSSDGPVPRASGGNWLLRSIIEDARADQAPNIHPFSIQREAAKGSDRADIVVRWIDPQYTLVIENKVHSTEGDQQCERYLRSFEINDDPTAGHLIFLTLHGATPKILSKRPDHPCVSTLSYGRLKKLLLDGLPASASPRETILVGEYATALSLLADPRQAMKSTPPESLSEASQLLFNHQEEIDALLSDCRKETARLISWIANEVFEQVKEPHPAFVRDNLPKHAVVRHPEWKRKGVRFGVALGSDHAWDAYHVRRSSLYVGVHVYTVSEKPTTTTEAAKELSGELAAWLDQHWPGKKEKHVKSTNAYGWPVWQQIVPERPQSVSDWASQIVRGTVSSSKELLPLLEKFAQDRR